MSYISTWQIYKIWSTSEISHPHRSIDIFLYQHQSMTYLYPVSKTLIKLFVVTYTNVSVLEHLTLPSLELAFQQGWSPDQIIGWDADSNDSTLLSETDMMGWWGCLCNWQSGFPVWTFSWNTDPMMNASKSSRLCRSITCPFYRSTNLWRNAELSAGEKITLTACVNWFLGTLEKGPGPTLSCARPPGGSGSVSWLPRPISRPPGQLSPSGPGCPCRISPVPPRTACSDSPSTMCSERSCSMPFHQRREWQ